MFKNLVASLSKRSSSFTKTNWLMPRREIIAVYPENYTRPVNKLSLRDFRLTARCELGRCSSTMLRNVGW
jgi:hypothetical protein